MTSKHINMNNAGLSRRSFLTGLAGVAGGAALGMAGCAQAQQTQTQPEEAGTSEQEQQPAAAPAAETAAGAAAGAWANERFAFRSDWLGEEPSVAATDIARTLEADIAVIGCGHSGSALTRRAAELGAAVVTLEAQTEEAFEAFGSDIGHLNSEWQRAQGIPEVDTVEFMDLFQNLNGNRTQPELVRAYATRSGEMFDWLLEVLTDEQIAQIKTCNWPVADDFVWQKGQMRAYPGTAKMNTDVVNTTALLRAQQARAIECGAQILYGTKAVCLVHDGGAVTGVVAQDADGAYVQVNAKSVVLAAGDYAGDSDMFTALIQEAAELNPGSPLLGLGRDGSGVRMGLWAGARMDPGPRTAMGANNVQPAAPVSCATLWLNGLGKRFCNEGWAHPFIAGVQGARQPFGNLYSLLDANWRNVAKNQLTGHGDAMFWDDAFLDSAQPTFDGALEAGAEGFAVETPMTKYTTYAAQTLEELASYVGLDASVVKAEVERYNQLCAAERDEDFAKTPELLFALDTPPYYLTVTEHQPGGRILVTLSGLFVDGQHRALGDDFLPIEGLYAVGNCSGGRFALHYTAPLHGASLGMANTLGYVLGEQLAQ